MTAIESTKSLLFSREVRAIVGCFAIGILAFYVFHVGNVVAGLMGMMTWAILRTRKTKAAV